MEKVKLNLTELTVNSFVTTVSEKEKNTVQGGGEEGTVPIVSKAIAISISELNHLCIFYHIAEAAESIARVIATVKRSAQTDCAAATRMMAGCTDHPGDTNSPCQV
jgi:hypothetical protein